MNTRIYYLSLCHGLRGYYVKFEATCESVVRAHAAKYFGRIWCSIYSPDEFEDFQKYCEAHHTKAGKVINEDPIFLGDCPDDD